MGEIVALPAADSMTAGEAAGQIAGAGWRQVIGIGVTAEGSLEIINSNMSAERALWLTEWARRWALGLIGDEI
ncbi:MAG: hypothetical protein ACKVOI_11290 [Dongiaceae bacterium]